MDIRLYRWESCWGCTKLGDPSVKRWDDNGETEQYEKKAVMKLKNEGSGDPMKRMRAFLLSVVLLLTMLLMSPGMVQAAALTPNQQVQTVQSLEDTLFAVHYDQDAMDARVGRLETTVFGQPQTGPLDARISKLQSVLSPSALGPLSPVAKATPAAGTNSNNQAQANPPTAMNSAANAQAGKSNPVKPAVATKPYAMSAPQATAGNSNPVRTAQSQPQSKTAPAPGETDYPTVSQMELKRFGKTYVQDDITVRLSRLEKDVFKTVQTGELADRVDNLRMVVLGDTGNAASSGMAYQNPSAGAGNTYYPQDPAYTQGPSYGTSYGNTSYNGPAGYPAYGSGGSSYPQPPNYGASPYTGTPIASGQPGYSNYYGGNNMPNNGQMGYGYPAPSTAGDPNGGYNEPGSYPNSYNGAPGTNGSAAVNGPATPDQLAAMSEVEKDVLGHTYPSEPLNARLDRVETKVFHTTSPELSNEDRIQRVIAVASAGGAPPTAKSRAKATFQTLLPIILTILPMVLL